MPIQNTHVAVVGGGIGGLTAALLLARAGAAVTVFERVSEPREVGAGLLLQPNGLAVLDSLSLSQPRSPRAQARRRCRANTRWRPHRQRDRAALR